MVFPVVRYGCESWTTKKVKSLSHVRLSATPWTAAYQAPPPMVSSRQEYWSGIPLPSPKKAECQRIDAFELWCWRRLLRVPWTARSNQSILKEINSDYSSEGLILKLQYFVWPPEAKTQLIGKDCDLGKIDGERSGRQRVR